MFSRTQEVRPLEPVAIPPSRDGRPGPDSFQYTWHDFTGGSKYCVSMINWEEKSFQIAILSIILDPLIWNIIARAEYYTGILTKLCFGKKYVGCYIVAVYIFCASSYRNILVNQAMDDQPSILEEFSTPCFYIGLVMLIVGQVFVLSSFYQLGITGTYLGDYFGIYLEERVSGFPFSVLEHPMYDGASLCFFGRAIMTRTPAGILLSIIGFVMYRIAASFEGPFTTMIYKKKAEEEAKRD